MPFKQIHYTCPPRDVSNGAEEDRHKNQKEEKDNHIHSLQRTFVLNVDEDAYNQLRKGHPRDISMKREQFDIMKFCPDGTLTPATPSDLWHFFEDRDEYHIAYLIALKGEVDSTFPKPEELHNEIFA